MAKVTAGEGQRGSGAWGAGMFIEATDVYRGPALGQVWAGYGGERTGTINKHSVALALVLALF